MVIRIAMWSGPRNISTAMMRAWGSRADTIVVDEPFYAAYLVSTGLEHPMRDQVIASQQTDWQAVARQCAGEDTGEDRGEDTGPGDRATESGSAKIIYQKHMAQHMIGDAPLGWMAKVRHAFLIRPPREVAASFSAKWEDVRARDLGFARQAELFDHVRELTGHTPPVIEARNVLENPKAMLSALCSALQVPFDPAMLSWKPGPRATDGVWGAHWYEAVNSSTGFSPPPAPASGGLPAGLQRIVEECEPFYQHLARFRLEPAKPAPGRDPAL